ncbi:MAG: hypothetical protein IGS03_02320 [Candidatus Sericytochromatia bacterium]|nr:hypothetical protein [Candidatus Sericytochromatia bacterium]
MRDLLGFVLLALLPGLFWLGYFYWKAAYLRPSGWILGTFGLGAVMVAPAMAVEYALQNLWMHLLPTPQWLFWLANFFFECGAGGGVSQVLCCFSLCLPAPGLSDPP